MKTYSIKIIGILFCCILVSGCKKTDEPCSLKVFIYFEEDGGVEKIYIEIEDGVEPYDIEWSNGETSALIFPSQEGTYTVTVTDALACSVTKSIDYDLSCPATITDSDGNVYTVVKVAGRCWTKTNLINKKGGFDHNTYHHN